MRNRGIEIFLLPQQEGTPAPAAEQQGAAAPLSLQEQLTQHGELQQVLALMGVPGSSIPAAMAATHAAVAAHAAQRHRRPPGLRELRRWALVVATLAGRGWPFGEALQAGWRQLYMHAEAAGAAGAEEATAVAQAAFDAYVLPLLEAQHQAGSCDTVLFRAASWPQPCGVAALAADSAAASTSRDAAVLLQHLAVLAAADLAACGSGAAAGALSSRATLVGEFGLAAAAASPAAALLQALTGSSAQAGAGAAVGDNAAALMCTPPAARLFAERCGVRLTSQRAAYAQALSAQLLRLVAVAGGSPDSRAVLAAQQAEQLICGVVSHPLVSAAAALQQQLAAAVQMPAAQAAFLRFDAAAAQSPQYLLAAGLQDADSSSSPDSGSLQALWQQVQEASSKVALLWQAVQAASVLRSAAASADAAVAGGTATLLQLSIWRHQRPKVRWGLDVACLISLFRSAIVRLPLLKCHA